MRVYSSLFCPSVYNSRSTLFISNNRDIYTIDKEDGFLKQIKELNNIKMISCGEHHIICLNYNGECYSFGSNIHGQLGVNKDETFSNIPKRVKLPHITQVSCGNKFTVCLSGEKTLYSFGSNAQGQLGIDSTENNCFSPTQINLTDIDFVECGGFFVICKTLDNKLYSWGNNANGDLGRGKITNCYTPGVCKHWPDNIIDIKSGNFHTLLLTESGCIYSFGSNYEGQLGLNIKDMVINKPKLVQDIGNIRRIECGYLHSICIDYDYNIWVFGNNSHGQLGLGDTEKKNKPVLHPSLHDIIDVSSGGVSTFVKTSDNIIYAFGYNDRGQLGTDITEDQLTPVQVLEGKEDIWCSTLGKSRQKSARK